MFGQLRLENMKAGRKGNLNVATEVYKKKVEADTISWVSFGVYL